MENTIITVIATFFSSLIASFVSVWVINKHITNFNIRRLSDKLETLNKIVIEYPYLEDKNFCYALPDRENDFTEEYLRYENYCCMVFNFLEQAWVHHNEDENKLKEFVGYEEMINLHSKWWLSLRESHHNFHGYKGKFRNFVSKVIHS